MKKEDFEKEIRESSMYALRYASDFYGAIDKKNYYKLFKIEHKEFRAKCYEGFKLAQNIIIKNILSIEDEIIFKKNYLKDIKRGKHKKDIKSDKDCKALEEEINQLFFQKLAFQDVASVIVWTIFLQQRTDIKSFVRPGGGSGYLKDRDIHAVIKVANELNKDPNKFTLITDITATLHVGDLITVGDGGLIITEVKGDSVINNLVSDIAHKALEGKEIEEQDLMELYKKSPKHGLKQLMRFFHQVLNAMSVKEYHEKDKVFDYHHKKNKIAVTILTKDKYFRDLIDSAIGEINKTKKNSLYFSTDCCIFGLFREDHGSEFVRRMDFKHYLYHSLIVPEEECQYLESGINFTADNPPEIVLYQEMFKIYDLREKIFSTVSPLFVLLKEDYVLDILFGKISVYMYFDWERFCEMCLEKGLQPKWLTHKEIDKHGVSLSHFPSFKEKYLQIGYKKSKIIFGYGLLFRIIFDFQWGYNIIDQIKEDFWAQTHPRLYKYRNFIHSKIEYFLFNIYFKSNKLFAIIKSNVKWQK